MKFIFAVITLAVVTTAGLADECEEKTKECVDSFRFIMPNKVDEKKDKKIFCEKVASIHCPKKLKDVCPQEVDIQKLEEMMEMLQEVLEYHCNTAGSHRNIFWVLASALISLFSVRKAL